MPFEARKTNFTVFSLNQELYNLIKSAFNMKLESKSYESRGDFRLQTSDFRLQTEA